MDLQQLLEEGSSIQDVADPVAALDRILNEVKSSEPAAKKLSLLKECAALLARAPLGSVDIYAPLIRHKLGVTKDSLLAAVKAARPASQSGTNSSSKDSFVPAPEDLNAAEDLLRSPNLTERFLSMLAELGIVGEKNNLLILLLTIVSRLLKRPISVVLKSASGAGKSFLLNAAISTLPPSEYVVLTAASAKALYFRTDSLAHKVLAFMERPGAEASDYQVRILQSEGKLIYSVAQKDPDTGQIVSNDREIEGPVAYIETTTQPKLHDENETRSFSLSLDESESATEAILKEQAGQAERLAPIESEPVLNLLRAAHSLLRPAVVVIPYASRIVEHFPRKAIRARRDFPRFLAAIEASAILHQFQRDRSPDGSIIAQLEDYALARQLITPLLDAAVSGATLKTRQLVDAAREMAKSICASDPNSVNITASKVMKHLPRSGWSKPTIRRHLKAADSAGYLELVSAARGRDSEYRLAALDDEIGFLLPTAEALQAGSPVPLLAQVNQGRSEPIDSLIPKETQGLPPTDQGDQSGTDQGSLFKDQPAPSFLNPDFD